MFDFAESLAFLQRVLPHGDDDWYCLVGLDINAKQSGRPKSKQLFANTWVALEAHAQTLIASKYNVYFACSSFKEEKKRTKANAKREKAFWMDLDVGEGDEKFDSKTEAREELTSFCEKAELPLPTIVDSGGGLHVYWVLDKAIDTSLWLPAAKRLKQLCVKHKFRADPACTSDAARILRVPGTLNYKTDPPGKVSVIAEASVVTFSTIENAVGKVTPKTITESTPRKIGVDEVYDFRKLLTLTKDGEGCEQIRWMLENPALVKEPLWRAGLSIARNCKDADKWVHKLSKNHPEYDKDLTDEKARGIVSDEEKESGIVKNDYSCRAFMDENLAVCQQCSHYNRKKGLAKGPLSLCLDIQRAEYVNGVIVGGDGLFAESNTEAHLEKKNEDNLNEAPSKPNAPVEKELGGDGIAWLAPMEDQADLGVCYLDSSLSNPDFMDGYYLSKEHRLFRTTEKPGESDLCIVNGPLYLLGHIKDTNGSWHLHIRFYKSGYKKPPIELLFETKHLGSAPGFSSHALEKGLVVRDYEAVRVMLVRWWEFMQQEDTREATMRKQLGWVDDNHSGFVVGDTELLGNGKIKYSPCSGELKKTAAYLQPKGDLEAWKKVVEPFSRSGWDSRAFAFASAFGSVLMSPAFKQRGVLLSLISSASGTGKTTLLKCINSVFGHPEDMLSQSGDTMNALILRLGVCNSISFTMDELTNMCTHKEYAKEKGGGSGAMGKLISTISQGRDKERMQSSINALRENNATWRTICVSTANASALDYIRTNKGYNDGESMRLMEYNLDMTEDVELVREERVALYDKALYENYGLAGRIYVDWVITHLTEVVNHVHAIHDELEASVGYMIKERFWSAAMSCTIAGCDIANKLGLWDKNASEMFAWVTRDLLPSLRDDALSDTVDYKEILSDFIASHWSRTIVVEDDTAHANGEGTFILHEPSDYNSCDIRYGKKDKKLYVHTQTLVDYLTSRQYLKKDMLQKLKEEGIFVTTKGKNGRTNNTHRMNLSKGTQQPITIRETYVFNWESIDVPDHILDEETTEAPAAEVSH